MDEKLKMPSSSCETPLHVLDSPKSKPEICENTECLPTSSTSVTENSPITSLKPMPNIKSKEVVRRELSLFPASDNNLDNAIKSISQSVKQLRAEQKKCNRNIDQIDKEFQILPDYLYNSRFSPEELFQKLKSPTASKELIDAEKITNSHLLLIKDSLRSITNRLNIPPSAILELKKALKSLKKFVKDIDPEQMEHKEKLTQIKESLQKELPLLPAAYENVVHNMDSVINFMELSIAELSAQNTVLTNIKASFNSIKKQFPQLQQIELSESENSGDTD